jgi:carbamate kinase
MNLTRTAAEALRPLSERTRLVVTHGNGPQVGLLALKEMRAPTAEFGEAPSHKPSSRRVYC